MLSAVFLAQSLNPRSIPRYLNIIHLMHLCVGLANPLEDWELNMIKKGAAHASQHTTKQKLPITLETVLRISEHLKLQDSLDCAFWCACLLAFDSFLRKSSLLPQQACQQDQTALQLRDLCIDESTTLFFFPVRHTKTVQFGQRTLPISMSGPA